MNNDEILLIQNYLRDLFDNEDISIRKEQDIPPSASLYVFSFCGKKPRVESFSD